MVADADAVAGVVRVGGETALRDEVPHLPVDVAGHRARAKQRERVIKGVAGDGAQFRIPARRLAGGDDVADVAPVIAEPRHDVGQDPFARGDGAAGRRSADVGGAPARDEVGEQRQAPARAGLQRGAQVAPDGELGAAGLHETWQDRLGVVAQVEGGADRDDLGRGLDRPQAGDGVVDGGRPRDAIGEDGGQVAEFDAEVGRVASGEELAGLFQVGGVRHERAGRRVAGVGEAGQVQRGEIGGLAIRVEQGESVRFEQQQGGSAGEGVGSGLDGGFVPGGPVHREGRGEEGGVEAGALQPGAKPRTDGGVEGHRAQWSNKCRKRKAPGGEIRAALLKVSGGSARLTGPSGG